MREILFAAALADDHRPNASDNNMGDCFKLTCKRWVNIQHARKKGGFQWYHFIPSNIQGIHNEVRFHLGSYVNITLL